MLPKEMCSKLSGNVSYKFGKVVAPIATGFLIADWLYFVDIQYFNKFERVSISDSMKTFPLIATYNCKYAQ